MRKTNKELKKEWEKKGVSLYEEIEVIAKKDGKVFKIIGITRIQWLEYDKLPGWSYIAYQKGFSRYAGAKEIVYNPKRK